MRSKMSNRIVSVCGGIGLPVRADTVALEKRLSDALGLDVTIEHRGKAGVVSVRYRNLEQLDEVVRRLGRH
jgi:ParB family chromosome partitioning protein